MNTTMAAPRFVVTPKWRLHYPGYVTRVEITDTVTGQRIDLADRDLANKLAAALEAGEIDRPATGLKQYRAERSPRGKTLIFRTISAAEGGIIGLATDPTLGESAVKVLNRLDPGQIAPPRRIRIYWF